MPEYFCLSVVFLDPQPAFHGRGDGGDPEWPPSPMRLFSAAVAGVLMRDPQGTPTLNAMRWLESQPAPAIVAPDFRVGVPTRIAVPNNDLDVLGKALSAGREPQKQPAEMKALKLVRPTHLVGGDTVHYLWPLPDDASDPAHGFARVLADAARAIVALGWGVDQVAARGWILTAEAADELPGQRWQPTTGRGTVALRAPVVGTLDALRQRHADFLRRLDGGHFSPVPPLSTFATVGYRRAEDIASWPFVAFSILTPDAAGFRPYDPVRATGIVAAQVRNAVARAAVQAGRPREWIATFVHGHTADGSGPARGGPDLARFSYLPLPSVERRPPQGYHVGAIRRVLLVAPPEHEAEIAWARRVLNGQELIDEASQQPVSLLALLPGNDSQLDRYLGRTRGSKGAVRWSTVTPVLLPGHDDGDARKGERLFRKALVQSGIAPALADSAELTWRSVGFHPGVDLATRYVVPACQGRRLRYHVQVRWNHAGRDVPLTGPLVLGAGRYGGFGLLAVDSD